MFTSAWFSAATSDKTTTTLAAARPRVRMRGR